MWFKVKLSCILKAGKINQPFNVYENSEHLPFQQKPRSPSHSQRCDGERSGLGEWGESRRRDRDHQRLAHRPHGQAPGGFHPLLADCQLSSQDAEKE
jgi:hypothetical protein